MESYVEIKIPGQTTTTEVEVDTSNKAPKVFVTSERKPVREPVEVILKDETNAEEEPTVVEKEQETPAPVKQQAQERKKPSRSNKRIRDLNNEKNELASQLEKERREKHELLKKVNESTKTSKETEKQSLEREIAALTQAMRQAMQDGDTDKVVTLQQQLMVAHTDLKVAQLEMNQVEEVPEYTPAPVKQPSMPEAATNWLEQHPEFYQDTLFHNAAKGVNQSLLMEGYDIESEDFYDELSFRLKRRFPDYFTANKEQFVPEEESVVEYTQDTPSPRVDVKPAVRPQAPQTTVSGASRTPNPASPTSRPNERRVSLDENDLYNMERWGMSMERMARRKEHIENNRRSDGYVPIIIPQK